MTTIVASFPTIIVNGTIEDAVPVMALFNWIKNQVNGNACPATVGTSILKGDGIGGTTAAVAGTDYATGAQVQNGLLTWLGTTTNVGDAYSASASPALTTYVTGQAFRLILNAANTTTTPSLNINTLGAVTLKRQDGSALVAGELVAGCYQVVYDGFNFRIGDYVSMEGLQNQQFTGYATGGSASAYTLTPYPASLANVAKQRFNITFHLAPTGSPTLSVSGLAALNLKYYDSTGAKQFVTSSLIPLGWNTDVLNDGTDWVVQNVLPAATRSTVSPALQAAIDASIAAAIATVKQPYLKYSYTLASGTLPEAMVTGAWTQLNINLKDTDTDSIGTLASNTITLPAGTYRVNAFCTMTIGGNNGDLGKLRLWNATTAATLLVGESGLGYNGVNTPLLLSGLIVLGTTTNLQLQYWRVGVGALGAPTSSGENEVYRSIEFVRNGVSTGPAPPVTCNSGYWSQVGTDIGIPDLTNNNQLAALSSTDVCFEGRNSRTLQAYRFDGSAWVTTGSAYGPELSTNYDGFNCTPMLSTGDIITAINHNTDSNTILSQRHFDGINWTVTAAPSIAGNSSYTQAAMLDSTHLVRLNTTSYTLEVWNLSGGTWTQVGSGYALGESTGNLAKLSATQVVIYRPGARTLQTLSWNGSVFTLVGSALNISATLGANAPLAALSGTDIAVFDNAAYTLGRYRFDGTNWALIGTKLTLSGTPSSGAMAALSSNRIAFADNATLRLRTYDFTCT